MKYIDKILHFYSTFESFSQHKESNLISPDSLCFIEESGQIYTQGSLLGVDTRVFKIIVDEVHKHSELFDSLLKSDEEDNKGKVIKSLTDVIKFLDGYTKDDNLKETINLMKTSLTNSISDIKSDISNITSLISDLNSSKVDKVKNKGLSTNDFTNVLRDKLDSLHNYDDTELRTKVNELITDFATLLDSNPTSAINSFNEIIAFLEHIADDQTLRGIIAGIETQIANVEKALSNYVPIELGKGLSTNDFTNEYKEKLDNVSESVNLSPITEDELNSILI